jgi:hypothetical protein
MMCIYLSLYKVELVANGYAQLEAAMAAGDDKLCEKLMAAIAWLDMYVPFQEWDIANDLEGAIDKIVMLKDESGKIDLIGLGKRIQDFWDACLAVPFCMTVGGFKSNGRIPERCKKNDPIVLVGPICEVQKAMMVQLEKLRDTVNAAQWKMAKRAPDAIFTVPTDEKMEDFARKMYKMWCEDTNAKNDVPSGDKKAEYTAFRDICKKHRAIVDRMPVEKQMQFMAALERNAYPREFGVAPVYESGPLFNRPKPFADGYVNNPEFFQLKRKLYRQERLVNPLHRVPLYATAAKLKRQKDVLVKVKDHVVYQYEDAKIIGLDTKLADGSYTLRYGVTRIPSVA